MSIIFVSLQLHVELVIVEVYFGQLMFINSFFR